MEQWLIAKPLQNQNHYQEIIRLPLFILNISIKVGKKEPEMVTADRQKSWLIELTKRIELKAGIVSLQILFFLDQLTNCLPEMCFMFSMVPQHGKTT